jgi:hypothetical protein
LSSTAPHPEWIEILYRPKRGRDQLGMSDVSPSEYMVALSPSVNAQTRHPRYHSFYAFLFDEFWRRDDLSRDHASLKEFFRPRDWAYSLAAQFCPEHGEMGGIVGSGTTRRLGASDAASFTFDPGYIQADLGGYELNYATPIAQLGFLYPGGVGMPTPVTIPSERGKELAAAFRKEIEHTAYYREYFGRDHVDVPREVFKEYAASGCLCYGKSPRAADRGILLDAFLHAGEEGRSHSRRQSMRLFLDIACQTDGVKLSEPGFRELLFFGASSDGARYRPADELAAHAVRWRYYQAREYYVYAVNGLFSHLCEWGRATGGDLRPLPMQDMWTHLDEALDFDSLADLLGVDAPGLSAESPYADLLTWLRDKAIEVLCFWMRWQPELPYYRLCYPSEDAVHLAFYDRANDSGAYKNRQGGGIVKFGPLAPWEPEWQPGIEHLRDAFLAAEAIPQAAESDSK